MPYVDYRCKVCEVIEEDYPSLSPPSCPNGHGEMRRIFTPLAIKVKGGTPKFHGDTKEQIAKIEWEAEREYDAKEDADNAKEIRDNTEKWKKEYISSGQHIKNGNPNEEHTREFKEAGVKPRKKSIVDHGFKHKAGGDIK